MSRDRRIGPWGTGARILVGIAALVGAWALGAGPADVALGLLAFPAAVTLVLALRGRSASAIRLHGVVGHGLNIAIGVALISWRPETALLFYGGSMLLAAWAGDAGCELLAVPNRVLRRDDEMGCPIFLPVDAAEQAIGSRRPHSGRPS